MNRSNLTTVALAAVFFSIMALLILMSPGHQTDTEPVFSEQNIKLKKTPESRLSTNKGRDEYFRKILKDPQLGRIPDHIRSREIDFAKKLGQNPLIKAKASLNEVSYTEVGPFDVSGRTRGLALDSRNSDVILAGGASGGIWKSIDGGLSWSLKSTPGEIIGISAIIQDPGNPDIWYASTAEFFGSARARENGGGVYYGSGIYKSLDNGENWNNISSTAIGNDPFLPDVNDTDVSFNSVFDFVSAIAISPVTGTGFLASNAFGVFRSTDGFVINELSIGAGNNHIYSEVAVTDNGVVYAVVSSPFDGIEPTSPAGVFISADDGETWQDITPGDFPSFHLRSVIGIAPSDQDIFYVLSDVSGGSEALRLFRFDASDPENVLSSNRSSGIPDFGGSAGDLNPQGGYNLVCKVSPANPDLVFIGGTNLFRSTDGFATVPQVDDNGFTIESEKSEFWIGGYATVSNNSQYTNHHPDQHNLVFDPNDPNRAFSAQDGGISVTNNISANVVSWQTRENGYNVTQFYTVSLHPDDGDTRIAGGTQDNGTPYFSFSVDGNHSSSADISSGDGSYTYLGRNYVLASSQNGRMLRFDYAITGLNNFSYVKPNPSGDTLNTLFIHPYAVNPSNEDILFYPDGSLLWRNNNMIDLPRNASDPDGTQSGWEKLANINTGTNGHVITALEFSTQSPSNRLYYAGYADGFPPRMFRLENANTSTSGEIDISIPGAAADEGAYIHDISVNPENGNEVIVGISNYGVQSLWYSNDAGATWSGVGGNLEGENGPSIRSVEIAPAGENGTLYFVGTSTGLYRAEIMDEDGTLWTPESQDVIGNVVIADMDYRRSDGTLAIATHGRGMFVVEIPTGLSSETNPDTPDIFVLRQNYPNPFNPSTSIEFSVAQASRVTITVYDVNGRKVATLLSNEARTTGTHSALFDAGELASSTYLYRIEARPLSGGSPFIQTKSMTLIK